MADDIAGRIDPRYSQGDLVKVARAQHQAEAEFVQSLLREEGIPSMVRRSAGFDVPDMLAAGPRDVLVPSSGELAAREVLLQAEIIDPAPQTEGPVSSPGRLLVGLLAFVALVGVIAWVGTEIIG
jgi:hypothetical protein